MGHSLDVRDAFQECQGVRFTKGEHAVLQTFKTAEYLGWIPSLPNRVLDQPETSKKTTPSVRHLERRGSFDDIASLYPHAVAASSDELAWQNIRVVDLRQKSNEMTVPASENHCILLNMSSPLRVSARIGQSNFEGEVRAGEVAIIPAGAAWSSRSEGLRPRSELLLFLRPLFVQSTARELGITQNVLQLNPQIGIQSKHLLHIGLSLLSELKEPNITGRLYADSLASALAMQLIRCYSGLNQVQTGNGGMAPHRLRKVVNLIDEHLTTEQEGRIALRVVAKEVGMSYFHFSRAFKQSMGMTLTNYIAERRIDRAKRLMQETALPISEIALRSGFSSQSHFTTSFRRFAGITPRSFRKGI